VEGDLRSQLAAAGNLALALQVGVPTPEVQAQALATFEAGISEPYLGMGISANVTAIAAIQAQLSALAGLVAALGTAGVVLLVSDTTLNALGGEITAAVAGGIPGAGPTDSVHALSLVATTPAAFAALGRVFRTS
jgi:hypothetical protein